jgi:hypothetical protein
MSALLAPKMPSAGPPELFRRHSAARDHCGSSMHRRAAPIACTGDAYLVASTQPRPLAVSRDRPVSGCVACLRPVLRTGSKSCMYQAGGTTVRVLALVKAIASNICCSRSSGHPRSTACSGNPSTGASTHVKPFSFVTDTATSARALAGASARLVLANSSSRSGLQRTLRHTDVSQRCRASSYIGMKVPGLTRAPFVALVES